MSAAKPTATEANQGLPTLRSYFCLIELACIMKSDIELKSLMGRDLVDAEGHDHYGFMLIWFFFKQLEHDLSIQTLLKAKHYADTGVIARVMHEGVAVIRPLA